jgi:hypothetical protein
MLACVAPSPSSESSSSSIISSPSISPAFMDSRRMWNDAVQLNVAYSRRRREKEEGTEMDYEDDRIEKEKAYKKYGKEIGFVALCLLSPPFFDIFHFSFFIFQIPVSFFIVNI